MNTILKEDNNRSEKIKHLAKGFRSSIIKVLVSANLMTPGIIGPTLLTSGLLASSCTSNPVEPEVIDNSMEAKMAWLKSQQEKDPEIKLETSIKMDAIQQFRVKYEITDHPFKLQVKEIVLEKPLVNQLRQWSNEILAAATQGQPTMDDLYVGFTLYNNQLREGVFFRVPHQLLFADQDEVTISAAHLNNKITTFVNTIANTAIIPTSFNADFAPRSGVEISANRSFWDGVSGNLTHKKLNENMNYSFPAGKDYKAPFVD